MTLGEGPRAGKGEENRKEAGMGKGVGEGELRVAVSVPAVALRCLEVGRKGDPGPRIPWDSTPPVGAGIRTRGGEN